MHIVCPHCENPIEVIQIKAREEVSCPSCGSSFHLESDSTGDWNPRNGQKFGRFELLRLVGQGAFGTVYEARDRDLDRTVAVKVPRAGNLGGGDLDRFLREARSVAQLRHPSIVPVYEVGQQDGVPYLVSEFVQGVTLADRITGDRLPPERIARMIAVAADAIQYAHEHGVIHRDIKPSNILLDAEEAPHVMDFGLAKREAGEITMTQEGQVLGTPAFMSPEQARGEAHRVDGRSDVYSLGVILYRLLTGAMPFKGNTRMLLHHVLHDEPKAPRKVDASVPRDLETICLKAMAKEPRGRYASAGALADDLRRFLKGEPIQARRVGGLERAGKWVRRRPAAAALLALCVLIVGAGVAVGIGLWQRDAAARKQEEDRKRAEQEAHQVKVEYYANIVKRRGVPEGIGPLTEEQAKHRQAAYRFSIRDGKVEKMEAVNGHGAPAVGAGWRGVSSLDVFGAGGKFNRACTYEYRRNEAGQLVEETALDQDGQVVWVFHYTTPRVGQFTDRRGLPLTRAPSGAAYVEFTWSENGFASEVRFLDRNGKLRPDNNRVYGYRYELDARGLPLETRYLGSQGEFMVHKDGYARLRCAYNALGDMTQMEYFDLESKPVLDKTSGCAKFTTTFDAHGNPAENAFFGRDGQPILAADMGLARWIMTWDDQGDIVEWGGLGLDGKPATGKGTCAKSRGRYDDRGNLIEIREFGLDGKPVLDEDGWARMTRVFDKRADALEWACYGLDDNPVACREGYARITHAHDVRGNVTEACYWGPDGKPALDLTSGVARETMAYDDHDNLIDHAYFGLDGKPTLEKIKGTGREASLYDDRDNLTETAAFGVDGKSLLDRHGVARIQRKYDDLGDMTEVDNLGIDGKATMGQLGYARATFVFDKDGNHTDSIYFDLDGKPVRTQVIVTDHFLTLDAEEFDLKTGDVLQTYDNQPVACAIKFVNDKRAEGVGDKPRELRLLRDGKPVALAVPGGWQPEGYGWQLETRAVAGDR